MIWRTVTLFLCSDLNKGLNAFNYLSCELIEQTQLNASWAISSSTSIIFLHAPHNFYFQNYSLAKMQIFFPFSNCMIRKYIFEGISESRKYI